MTDAIREIVTKAVAPLTASETIAFEDWLLAGIRAQSWRPADQLPELSQAVPSLGCALPDRAEQAYDDRCSLAAVSGQHRCSCRAPSDARSMTDSET